MSFLIRRAQKIDDCSWQKSEWRSTKQEREVRSSFVEQTWFVMLRWMILFFSMILTAKSWPESVCLANLTLPKLPSPRVLPNSYFPSRILSFFFLSFRKMPTHPFPQTSLLHAKNYPKQRNRKEATNLVAFWRGKCRFCRFFLVFFLSSLWQSGRNN